MTGSVARIVFPCALAFAVALWVKSSSAVGDGFSAGAVAGLGAVVLYACLDHERAARLTAARFAWSLVAAGLFVVLAVSFGPTFFDRAPVTHFPEPGTSVSSFGPLKWHTATLFEFAIAVMVYGAIVGTFDRLFPPLRGDEP